MANPSLVQSTTGQDISGGNHTTFTKAYASNNTFGNLLVVIASGFNVGTTVTITDSQGNPWSSLPQTTQGDGGWTQIWYTVQCKAGANTITATYSGNTRYVSLWIAEYVNAYGVDNAGAAHGEFNNGASATITAPSITTVDANALVIQYSGCITEGNSGTNTGGHGWTSRNQSASPLNYLVIGDQVLASAGAIAVAISTQATPNSGGIVAFTNTAPPAATPTFSPVAGEYAGTQNVTISSTTPSPTFYYTTDGSTPTTGSTLYTGPVAITQNTTLKAIATATAFSQSAVGSAVYTIDAAVPTFAPVGGTYHKKTSVGISSTSAGVTIYYTTDGTNPTTGSPVYSTAISVTKNTTLKAIASGGNFGTSAVGSAVYVIKLPQGRSK